MILAVATSGGHWIELMELKEAWASRNVHYVSTDEFQVQYYNCKKYTIVTDANKYNKMKIIRLLAQMLKIIIKTKPSHVITTGAAPGLIAIAVGRLFRAKCIWIDSLANTEDLSLSGKIATYITDLVITQSIYVQKKYNLLYFGEIL